MERARALPVRGQGFSHLEQQRQRTGQDPTSFRLHLDVRAGTGLAGDQRLAALEAGCARLVALGAVRVRLLPADDGNESCLVMQDIEGNEFCLD